MKWSIVIPTYLRSEHLVATLRALGNQSVDNFEVVVVSDGPDPDILKLEREFVTPFPVRWLFQSANMGQAAARNAGARAATGKLLIFLDDDIIAGADLLQHHEAQHRYSAYKNVVVHGRLIEQRQLAFTSNTDRLMQAGWERYLDRIFPEDVACDTETIGQSAESTVYFGLNCSILRRNFFEVGEFDENLRSDEDCEFGYRLYNSGYIFKYAKEAYVAHRGSKDLSKYFPDCWARSGTNDLYRVRKLNQRCAQTLELGAFRHNSIRRRWAARMAWGAPKLFGSMASIMEDVTNTTNSKISFALWARLRRLGEYWNSVRESGASFSELCELAGHPSRILMFHSISEPHTHAEADFYVRGARFRHILMLLRVLGYVITEPNDFLAGQLPKKSVIMSFDDAYDDLYTELLPLMEKTKIAPLIFVVANAIGGTNIWDHRIGYRARSLLTLDKLREMQRHGAVIGAHSLTHATLPSLSRTEMMTEIRDSKLRLEDLFGCPVHWFAYPFGQVNRKVRAAVIEAGFKAAVTTEPGLNFWQDQFALRRIEMNSHGTSLDLVGKLLTGKDVRRGLKNQIRQR